MINFFIGLIVGIFLIPTIAEIYFSLSTIGFKRTLKEPIELLKEIIDTTFKGDYYRW